MGTKLHLQVVEGRYTGCCSAGATGLRCNGVMGAPVWCDSGMLLINMEGGRQGRHHSALRMDGFVPC